MTSPDRSREPRDKTLFAEKPPEDAIHEARFSFEQKGVRKSAQIIKDGDNYKIQVEGSPRVKNVGNFEQLQQRLWKMDADLSVIDGKLERKSYKGYAYDVRQANDQLTEIRALIASQNINFAEGSNGEEILREIDKNINEVFDNADDLTKVVDSTEDDFKSVEDITTRLVKVQKGIRRFHRDLSGLAENGEALQRELGLSDSYLAIIREMVAADIELDRAIDNGLDVNVIQALEERVRKYSFLQGELDPSADDHGEAKERFEEIKTHYGFEIERLRTETTLEDEKPEKVKKGGDVVIPEELTGPHAENYEAYKENYAPAQDLYNNTENWIDTIGGIANRFRGKDVDFDLKWTACLDDLYRLKATLGEINPIDRKYEDWGEDNFDRLKEKIGDLQKFLYALEKSVGPLVVELERTADYKISKSIKDLGLKKLDSDIDLYIEEYRDEVGYGYGKGFEQMFKGKILKNIGMLAASFTMTDFIVHFRKSRKSYNEINKYVEGFGEEDGKTEVKAVIKDIRKELKKSNLTEKQRREFTDRLFEIEGNADAVRVANVSEAVDRIHGIMADVEKMKESRYQGWRALITNTVGRTLAMSFGLSFAYRMARLGTFVGADVARAATGKGIIRSVRDTFRAFKGKKYQAGTTEAFQPHERQVAGGKLLRYAAYAVVWGADEILFSENDINSPEELEKAVESGELGDVGEAIQNQIDELEQTTQAPEVEQLEPEQSMPEGGTPVEGPAFDSHYNNLKTTLGKAYALNVEQKQGVLANMIERQYSGIDAADRDVLVQMIIDDMDKASHEENILNYNIDDRQDFIGRLDAAAAGDVGDGTEVFADKPGLAAEYEASEMEAVHKGDGITQVIARNWKGEATPSASDWRWAAEQTPVLHLGADGNLESALHINESAVGKVSFAFGEGDVINGYELVGDKWEMRTFGELQDKGYIYGVTPEMEHVARATELGHEVYGSMPRGDAAATADIEPEFTPDDATKMADELDVMANDFEVGVRNLYPESDVNLNNLHDLADQIRSGEVATTADINIKIEELMDEMETSGGMEDFDDAGTDTGGGVERGDAGSDDGVLGLDDKGANEADAGLDSVSVAEMGERQPIPSLITHFNPRVEGMPETNLDLSNIPSYDRGTAFAAVVIAANEGREAYIETVAAIKNNLNGVSDNILEKARECPHTTQANITEWITEREAA
ncbi:MAG: hypothetical protein ABID45_03105 [Patescibacteria group bacterium]